MKVMPYFASNKGGVNCFRNARKACEHIPHMWWLIHQNYALIQRNNHYSASDAYKLSEYVSLVNLNNLEKHLIISKFISFFMIKLRLPPKCGGRNDN